MHLGIFHQPLKDRLFDSLNSLIELKSSMSESKEEVTRDEAQEDESIIKTGARGPAYASMSYGLASRG